VGAGAGARGPFRTHRSGHRVGAALRGNDVVWIYASAVTAFVSAIRHKYQLPTER